MNMPKNSKGSDQAMTENFLEQLRHMFRKKGLLFANVAREMQVSERTVKRYMSGKGLTLPVLNRLCSIADITLIELAEEVKSRSRSKSECLTIYQEAELKRDIRCCLAYNLILLGFSNNLIMKEMSLSEIELTGYLTKLDRLGVINLLPGNRVRIRKMITPAQERSAFCRNWVAYGLQLQLDHVDFSDPEALCDTTLVRLPPVVYARAMAKVSEIFRELEIASSRNDELDNDREHWYTVFLSASSVDDLKTLLQRSDDAKLQMKS